MAELGRLDGTFNKRRRGDRLRAGAHGGIQAWQAELGQNLTSVCYSLKDQIPATASPAGAPTRR